MYVGVLNITGEKRVVSSTLLWVLNPNYKQFADCNILRLVHHYFNSTCPHLVSSPYLMSSASREPKKIISKETNRGNTVYTVWFSNWESEASPTH